MFLSITIAPIGDVFVPVYTERLHRDRAAGERFQMHDPTSWPDQAKLAAEGRWDELKELQDILQGGREG